MEGTEEPGGRAFFGRRKGKKLRPAQSERLQHLLPALALPLDTSAPADLRSLFPAEPLTSPSPLGAPLHHASHGPPPPSATGEEPGRSADPPLRSGGGGERSETEGVRNVQRGRPERPVRVGAVRLEIGFGGAEHLLHAAAARPDIGFIGIEPFVNGMAKALAGIEAGGLRNVRLSAAEATEVLDWLPAASLAEVDLLYPDPWPKQRHWKRRFVSAENLARLARVLRPGGTFRFASDIPSYVEWTLRHVAGCPDFSWTAERADDWRRPWPAWPGTRYEAKALREGRVPTYLTFRRN